MFVLLDSNVWLAALAHDGFCRRVVDASAALCTCVITPFLCAEVREKLVTKFQRTQEQADELISRVVSVSLLRDDAGDISSPLRDPKDIQFLQPLLHIAANFSLPATITF